MTTTEPRRRQTMDERIAAADAQAATLRAGQRKRAVLALTKAVTTMEQAAAAVKALPNEPAWRDRTDPRVMVGESVTQAMAALKLIGGAS